MLAHASWQLFEACLGGHSGETRANSRRSAAHCLAVVQGVLWPICFYRQRQFQRVQGVRLGQHPGGILGYSGSVGLDFKICLLFRMLLGPLFFVLGRPSWPPKASKIDLRKPLFGHLFAEAFSVSIFFQILYCACYFLQRLPMLRTPFRPVNNGTERTSKISKSNDT